MTKYIFLAIFLRKVFSDYFKPVNVLYIDRGSHNSVNFINKYITLILVNLYSSARLLSLQENVPTGNL